MNDGSNTSVSSSMHKFVGRSPIKSGSQVQAQALRPMTPQKSLRPTTPLTRKTVGPTILQIQKSTMHTRPITPARPTMPVVQLDEDTIRSSLIDSDDNLFARVESVRMLKPAVKKGKARSAQENGIDDV